MLELHYCDIDLVSNYGLQMSISESDRSRKGSAHENKTVADDYAKKQREEIVRALTDSKGRVGWATGVAARMGINRNTLVSRMKKFGLYPKQYV